MRGFSYKESTDTIIFNAPSGASFPVSSKAVCTAKLTTADHDQLDSVMFTMRSEPTEPQSDQLDSVMFTMRSEPTEPQSDQLDSVMFTMRSEPTEH